MPLIIDPDELAQGSEVVLSTTNKTIQLSITTELTSDGVTGQALYSFLKEQWKIDADLIPFPFPMVSITPEQFEFVNGWKPADVLTRELIRFAGWREIDASNQLQKQFMNVTSLGDIGENNRAYYAFSGDEDLTSFSFDGPVNQGVQVYSADPIFDRRQDELTTFIRTQGQLYGSATTSSIGLTALNYIANRFPLAETADVKIAASDATIASTAPYTGMAINYGAITRNIGGTNYNYDILIDGNQGTAEQIYEFVQYSLRQGTDIDAAGNDGIGALAGELLAFLGNTLKTRKGVYVDNFQANDTNRIIFTDTSAIERTFPFVASGSFVFNENLQDDTNASYHVFFTNTFGTGNATIVKDNDDNDLTGLVNGNASIGFSFDYDNNIQGDRTAGTDADVTVVAIGLGSAQYVVATATIGRASGQNISLVAPLERNYSNPA